MSVKAAVTNGVNGPEAALSATVGKYLAEMATIRRRMKSTDARIRRADASIRRDLDETRAILRHVQATR